MKKNLQDTQEHTNGTLSQGMGAIYKLHNGMELEADLKLITNDKTFQFLKNGSNKNEYVFENSLGQQVILNNFGEIEVSDIGDNPIFSKISSARIRKTERMINSLSLENDKPLC